jgi:2-methylcitrate dehydratase PrpD
VEWAGRVELLLDQTIETRFPTQAAARTVIKTNKGRFERLIEHPWGDPANPFDRIDLERKLRTLARGRLSEIDVQKILNGLATIQEGNLSELFRVLGELRL